MATYEMIRRRVRDNEDSITQTCWIAHVKADYGLTRGSAPNRHDPARRVKPRPPEKRAGIVRALQHFRMI